MTTSTPAVVSFGDIQQVTMVAHATDIVSVCLRPGGLISLHREGDNPEILTDLPFLGSKDKLGASVIGDILQLTWGTGGEIVFARWNLNLNEADLAPTEVFDGSRPTLQTFLTDKLVLDYISPISKHSWRVSEDSGDTWTSEMQIHANDVSDTGVSVSSAVPNAAVWVETEV